VRAGIAAVAVAALLGCRGAGGVAQLQAHEDLDAVLWYATAAEFRAASEQAYHWAAIQLDAALAPGNRSWTAALEQGGEFADLPPAVVLDIDECVLDTSDFQSEMVRSGRPFDIESWNAWVRKEEAELIPGALDFVAHAVERDVRVFFLTNRRFEVEQATLRNLARLGFPVDPDGVNLLTRGEDGDDDSDKTARRASIASRYRIVLIVGDDLNDFLGETHVDSAARMALADRYRAWWGSKWILIPNPIYGGWERSIFDSDPPHTRDERLKRKYEALPD
jgi:acid phosphatase